MLPPAVNPRPSVDGFSSAAPNALGEPATVCPVPRLKKHRHEVPVFLVVLAVINGLLERDPRPRTGSHHAGGL